MAKDVEFNYTATDKTGPANESVRRRMKKTGDEAEKGLGDSIGKGATKGAASLTSKLQGAFGVSGVSGGQLLAVAGVVAAPVIGAALSAAVIGGAGVGGVIGGVLLAARDPRVAAAGTQLGQTLLGKLQDDAAPFVDPILRNIGKVEARFEQMNGRIKNIFSTSSGFLDPLVNGLLDGVDGILRGVDSLVAKARPVINSLGQSFTIIGNAVGDALTTISGDSEDAASALTNLAKVAAAAIQSIGYLVRGLTELYGIVSFLPGKFMEMENAVGGWVGLNEAARTTVSGAAAATVAQATALGQVAAKATSASGPVATFTDEVRALAEAGHAAFDSETNVGAAIDAVKEKLKGHNKTLDANTEKGRANRTVLSQLATAMQKQYEASVQVNGEGAKSNAVAAQNRAAFIKLAAAFTGSKQKAAELATQMGLIPPKKNTSFTANTHDAEARIQALKEKIAGVKGKSVNVNVIVNASRLAAVENRLNRLHGGALAGSSASYFAQADQNSGRSRTGGPTPVEVSNRIYLDGAPFYAMTRTAVDAAQSRQAWRAKVGRR